MFSFEIVNMIKLKWKKIINAIFKIKKRSSCISKQVK